MYENQTSWNGISRVTPGNTELPKPGTALPAPLSPAAPLSPDGGSECDGRFQDGSMNTAASIRVFCILALILFGFVLCACERWSGQATRKWTEDVLLDDGSTIVVERTVSFKETNSLSGDAYNAVETDATISFTGELANLPSWHVPLMALVMYRDKETSEWVVVALTTSTDVWYQRGKPCPKYWEFRLNNNGWREVPLSPASVGRPANLLHRYQDDLGSKHITVKLRKTRESDVGINKRFAKIVSRDEAKCTN